MSGETKGLFWITKDLDFDDILHGKISYPQAYLRQNRGWITAAADILAQDRAHFDMGIALLSIQLMFFEPHGYYLGGEGMKNRNSRTGQLEWASKKSFKLGFGRFVDYLRSADMIDSSITAEELDSIYKWARCGSMHALTMSSELVINSYNSDGYVLSKKRHNKMLLIDPWKMLLHLKPYLAAYVETVEGTDPISPMRTNFNYTFDELIIRPGNHFSNIARELREGLG